MSRMKWVLLLSVAVAASLLPVSASLADDVRATIAPAVLASDDASNATIQLARHGGWGGGWRGGGWGGGWRGGGWGGGYYGGGVGIGFAPRYYGGYYGGFYPRYYGGFGYG